MCSPLAFATAKLVMRGRGEKRREEKIDHERESRKKNTG
jgi:hypothetical protein